MAMREDDRLKGPFSHLKLSSWDPLRSATREVCPKCKSSRKVYCYDCFQFLPNIDPTSIPRISLPVPVDIIKHSQEVQGKSTATHAVMLAPDNVSIHTYPSLPPFSDPNKCLLVFPREGALSVSEWVRQNGTETAGGGMDWRQVERVVFIDSTWIQTRKILKDVDHLPCVVLTNEETHFWRPQTKTTSHLATIEAIYYFFRETCQPPEAYKGEYDNLLYFYAYQYNVVHEAMDKRARDVEL
ncbi:tRNA-uridine aminocarboxypropyltransferase 1 [Geodia barretti]|uniref:tRNA-uridine aminocarboxypropyltransferase 1 n=1 Tax=Geodia barretti TaxID=519541 RepID=A0AA35R3K5_GEOBA|nr:tRNA-uridine aminocarboxypropyltransferase 1 [Geodia barretti]